MSWWKMTTLLVISTALVLGQTTVPAVRDEKQQERAKYRTWLLSQATTWARRPDKNGRWRSDGSPWAPFEMARMFRESDLVIECKVRPSLHEHDDGRMEYHPLLMRVDQIVGVHKGSVTTGTIEWKTKRQLAMSVMVHEMHTGHWGRSVLRSEKPYLLFLEDVGAAERRARGYTDLPGRLLRINRIWHGAIALYDGNPPGQAGAYCVRRMSQYRALGVYWQDVRSAVCDMSLAARVKPSERRVSSLQYRAKMCNMLTEAALTSKSGEVDSVLAGIPERLMGEYEGILAYRAFKAERHAEARKKHLAHLRLLAALAGDVAKVASGHGVTTTQPSRPASRPTTENGT